MSRTIIALDVGKRKIGLARANTVAKIAQPLITLPNDDNFISNLQDLIKEHDVDLLVVGLPRGLDGQETHQTKYVRDFVSGLDLTTRVVFQDEALTSIDAREILDKTGRPYHKDDIDSTAATLILESYIKDNYDEI